MVRQRERVKEGVLRRNNALSCGRSSIGRTGTTGSHLLLNSHFWFQDLNPCTPL
ncbi:hypothetical protein DPMN_078646 [Dreissena polymorpha]|uniref:Uncharacterized protein n=1 Tax=Dreissena polymorpha TaxID=45954 RepID=A0A9D4BSB6_DREPO|nr:hypothetical protein DPMN_078615 [Dreissena polymorpha]KAH3703607.1 hypothetical protein DPMN_078646 [Dreissena polymorpha]